MRKPILRPLTPGCALLAAFAALAGVRAAVPAGDPAVAQELAFDRPADFAAKEVKFVSCSWQLVPKELTELPPIGENAKAGVALMDGVWYGIAKKGDANAWVPITGKVDLSRRMSFTVNVQKGERVGEACVTYILGTTVNAALPVAVATTEVSRLRVAGAADVTSVRARTVAPSAPPGPTAADVATVGALRAAIADRKAFPDGSTVTLAAESFDIGKEADPTPITVDRPLVLAGLSRTGTVLSGNGTARCLRVTGDDVVISNLTVAAGCVEVWAEDIREGVGIQVTGKRTKIVGIDVRDCTGRILGGGDLRLQAEGAGLVANATTEVRDSVFRNCRMENSSTCCQSKNVGAVSGGSYYGCAFERNTALWTEPRVNAADVAAVWGAAVLSNCTFRGNHATRNGAVGATARIADSTFVGNVSSNGYGSCVSVGGFRDPDCAVIARCTFADNVCLHQGFNPGSGYQIRGGAVSSDYLGGVVVLDCVFRGNRNVGIPFGAAISGRSGTRISVRDSVFEGNVGGADVYDDGASATVVVERCAFKDKPNDGTVESAIRVPGGTLAVRESTFGRAK